MPMTPEQRSARARKAAYAKHAKHDSHTAMEKPRKTFDTNLVRRLDPTGTLSTEQLEAARSAYYQNLATKSVATRKRLARARQKHRERHIKEVGYMCLDESPTINGEIYFCDLLTGHRGPHGLSKQVTTLCEHCGRETTLGYTSWD